MFRHTVAICMLFSLAVSAFAQITVPHITSHVSPCRAGYNASPSYATLDNWPSADGLLAEFDRITLHSAIDATIRSSDPIAMNTPQTLAVTLAVRQQDADIPTANSYDDAWEDGPNGWVAAMWHTRLNSAGKTDGFITLPGDSITYAAPFSDWPRSGAGKTAADDVICNWMHADHWGDGSNTSDNGWYLASHRVRAGGSFTAQGGITSSQYLTGSSALPSVDQMFTPGFTNPDGKQYTDCLMAVILLGTNDTDFNRSSNAYIADITNICNKLLAQKIVPILTTLPPKTGDMTDVQNYNTALRNLAQTRSLPLIDFYAEILRRQPSNSWQNTLIGSDGVHPTIASASYDTTSDPYTNNGEPLSSVGYLLRSWLTVQKVAEIKAKVLDRITGDTDGDTHIDVVDLLNLAATWTLSLGAPAYDQRCDFNGDNTVDIIDLLTLANNFGKY